jgi:amino acid adenylation domain-containing protein/non-ribosomal peptide synthase protein (TIGR01720 family)
MSDTMNVPTASVAALSRSEKQEMLRKILMEKMNRTRTAPASFAQERLWFLDRMDASSAAYNIPAALRLDGEVDAPALERALGEIVRRHETLRTTFREENGGPVQVIAPFGGFALPVEDLSTLPADEREALTATRARDEAARPFDLAAGPLFRASLVRLAPREHLLMVTMHHIVSDGWSLGVFMRELGALYAAYRTGAESPLPELTVQYADYVARQREQLRGEALDRELAWWKDRLSGAPGLLELPTDRPRPAVRSERGAREAFSLDADVVARLEQLARAEGSTLYMVLLGAFQVLLGKYAGSDDVVVGSPIAGRTRTEDEALIGFFINTLVLRTDLSGDPRFRELLGRVRQGTLGAYEHQEVPFEKLVAELQPERSMSHSPLFQVMFTLQNAQQGTRAELAPGVSIRPAAAEGGLAKFDLALTLASHDGGVRGGLEYSTELWDASTVRRMLEHLRRVLVQVAADADVRLSGLELLTDDERAQVVDGWNRTAAPAAETTPVHERFAAHARRAPHAPAVVQGDTTVTYGELEGRANRLARFLRARGVGPDARVGVCLERGIDLVVANLAVVKAGGAYVAMDPGYPAERLAHMASDAGVRIVLTQASLRDSLVLDGTVEVVATDAEWPRIATESAEAVESGAGDRDAVYVIYTSGSTGTPKGVTVEHGGLRTLCDWHADAFGVTEADRATAVASPGFDASAWEVWPYLSRGACIHVVPEEVRTDPEGLRDWLLHSAITVSFIPTPVAEPMLALPWPARAPLRWLLVGGDRLQARPRAEIPFRLSNNYGPTECTVVATSATVAPEGAGAPSIGGPIRNTRVYVLDGGLRPVPAGVPGELFIGGAQVARGYLNRPALTAERFVPDAFAAEPGARMYRSGDAVRWRADGTLDYLGRLDAQVKVRGFRIELGEIEAALRGHDSVRECVVVVREDAPGDRRLVAYVVGAVDADELRAHLRRGLPEYMVPAAFVAMDALPLTANGKLDRRALPAPAAAEDAYVAPRTPTEEVVAGVWAEVLRLDRVGVDESFFALGGHSLLATRVVSRIREVLGAELPLRALFEAPTVAELAARVEALRGDAQPRLAPVVRVERGDSAPLSFAQERLWFLDRLEGGSSAYNIPAGLRLSGALDAEALERALGEIVRRHEALRTVFREIDGAAAQVVQPFAGFALARVDLSQMEEAERDAELRRFAAAEAARPFDLAAGPLFRAALVRLAGEEHVLLLGMHHIVSDGWSAGVLFRELSALYTAFTEGRPSPLAELPVQYADFAVWQRTQLDGEALDRQLAWWTERMTGAPALLELPTDHARPAVQSYRGALAPVTLSSALVDRLQALARAEGATLYMVMLGAFQTLLSRYAGTEDVVVGSPIAGRTRRETEELIGLFVNTLVMRTDLSGDPTFREVLRRVRETTLGAYAHQEVPFERLVAELQPERSLGHAPLFQVLFTLQNADRAGRELPGLRAQGFGAELQTTKFDLSLALMADERGARGVMTYATDLFDRATVERMLAQLERVLEQVAADADACLSSLELMDAAERETVVQGWNRTEAAYPADACFHDLFEAQAARTPDAVALVCEEQALTYAELNARANQLAHRLMAHGVGPDARVAMCFERGAEMIVALLGIVKAGGAYVALDASLPAERLRYMLRDSRAAALVTRAALVQTLPAEGIPVVLLDADATLGAERAENPRAAVSPESLVYTIYTSGSTGEPKGVGVEHRQIVNYVHGIRDRLGLEEGASYATVSTLSADLGNTVVFSALAWGGTLHVIREERIFSGDAVGEYFARHGIDCLKITPSHLAALQNGGDPRRVMPRRWLVLGGESSPLGWVDSLLRMAPECAVFNHYGPTETTVGALTFRATAERPETPSQTLVLGRPLPNYQAFVVDASLRPLPVGVPGELLIGGAGVARGYLGRPELTDERFIANPFGAGRVYRTGDRVRMLADGNVEFLGRMDGQVKIRGFRVELGEIEAALRQAPGVAECAVVARDDSGDLRLVAYVVGGADAEALRALLRRDLPEYMVPAAFVRMDALPLTANGKLDRRALPAPEAAAAGDGFVAPRTPAEELVASIWAEVLRVERVGATDGFFALGGHSLLATRVVTRVRQVFGVELPVRALFEGPTVAELAERIEAMRRDGAAALPPVVPVERTGALPLSFAQERLWFLHQLEENGAVYNLPAALRLNGALDAAALERAVGEVVRRHESLRTRFRQDADGAVQVIAPFAGFTLPVEDLSGTGDAELRTAAVRRRIAEEAARPFDLAAGAPFRATLLRVSADEHVLVTCMHHVASDGWSVGVLCRELAALYTAFAAGQPSPLAELPVQYADFAAWQRTQLEGEVLDRQLAWWKAHLAGAPALLELPTDHARPAVQTYRGAREPVAFSAELLARLEALGRAEGATLYMVLLAAFQVMLGKYAGAEDVVVGSPIAGRTRRETEELIGFFVNTLVLRTDLSGQPTFREVLRGVRKTTLGAYEHQDVPFEKLVAELQPERSMSHSPLFQVMFMLQNTERAGAQIPGVRMERVGTEAQTTKFDLTLSLGADERGLRGAMDYAADLWDAATVRRMVGHLERVLEQVAADADLPLDRLTLLPAAERATVIGEWNATETEFRADACMHQLVAEQAARTPEAVALVFADQSLTYGELDARANRLAHRLRALGVGPDTRVAVCMERGLELVVALLATHKAGGAYVPLDPTWPADRLEHMLRDSGARVLLSQGALRPSLPACGTASLVCMDEEAELLAALPATAPAVEVSPANLAYVIYTSGSTGRPKGVAVPHRTVSSFFTAMDERIGTEPGVWLAVTSVSFDISVLELFWTLARGFRVVLHPAGDPAVCERMIEVAATHFQCTPSLAEAVVREPGAARALGGLRRMMVGGEALPAELADALCAKVGGQVLNMYGPTETTIWSTTQAVEAGVPVTVGRPALNNRTYVVDAAGEPVPVGVAGELFIGGVQVARGYLGRPALTAERFVPDAFAAEPGARAYRTGDRVRWLADGRIEYLGRMDFQVKIRGFRIELGEIEATLRAADGVRECAVVARETGAGDRRLVAYVVGEDGAVDAAALREQMRRSLPEYMVPSAIVAMDALPLTPNGKLDRKALPAPEAGAPEEAYVAPRTPLEEVMAGVWAEVLRLERVGVTDNFFELGGHSLLATRLVSRIREVLDADLRVVALFEGPTVAELARAVEEARSANAPRLPDVAAVDPADAMLLSFAQERLWLIAQIEGEQDAAYNLPAAVRLSGALDAAALERALGEIVRRHDALRTVFAQADGVPVQLVRPFDGFALTVEEAAEADVRRRAAEEAARPFDLAAGPLFRATLLRVSEQEHVLLTCMHHIVSDGWSMGVLFRELGALYAAFAEGRESPLRALPIQYADFAAWQRRHLQGEVLDRHLEWWTARMAGAPALLELPTDRPRPPVQSSRGARVPVQLPRELLDRLQALGRGEGATLYMVLLGAFQLLLGRYAGTDDVVVGSPIAGRTRAEVEPLIGFFVNTLAMRTDLSGDPTFRQLLRRVRETTLGAYEHQEVPFEKLVSELRPERTLAHSPLVQVLFALQNTDRSGADIPGLRMQALGSERESSKFDLTLTLAADERGLHGAVTYSTDLFERSTVERMLGHLRHLLEQLAADADLPLSALELLDVAERETVLQAWNRTESAYPADACFHRMFEAQAARTPDAVALVCEEQALTYAELNARANQIAHRLIGYGVGPDVPVAICFERSAEMVIALLGILKAGGAYVPLDARLPLERLRYMLADSFAAALGTCESLLASLPPLGIPVVLVDTDETLHAESVENPCAAVSAENLAYVVYTSGSTGEPKGVGVEHRQIVNYVHGIRDRLGLEEGASYATVSTLSADLGNTVVFSALAWGGTLHVIREERIFSGDAVGEYFARHGIDCLKITPSHLAALQNGGDPRRVMPRRWLVLGGESSPLGWVDSLLGMASECAVFNHYGPTETTVGALTFRATAERPETPSQTLVLGRPLPNYQAFVVDASLRPLPVGVPGELLIGGAGVARGYLRRPELTEERFIANPFGAGRVYRTGDRVRMLADGNVEFLGRMDQQVKIRGFRVEPGEIEAALRQAGAMDCAVVAREDAPGQRRLVAYVVGGPDAEALRATLRPVLPDYMIPAAFVRMDALPLTANGKVDRRALPAPEVSAAGDERFVAPRNAVERTLAGVWAEVLRLDRVGVEDSFFELGGDSLLAIQVVSRARRAGVEVSPRQLFEYQTVAELASVARVVHGAEPADEGRPEGAVRLTPIQARFFEAGMAAPWHYNQARPMEVDASVSDGALEAALDAVLEHHDALRLRYRRTAAGWEQAYGDAHGIRLERVDLSALPAEARDAEQARVAGQAQASLDLEHGPLGRAVLLDRGEQGRTLLLVLHHLVVDNVSWGVLRDDLERACAMVQAGEAVELGARGTSFAGWARALEAFAGGDAAQAQAAHWLAQGAEGVAPLPVDGRGEGTVEGAGRVTVALDAEDTAALLHEVPAAYRTQINDVLLCALADAVGEWTGGSRVRLALEGHGREEEAAPGVDLTRTVGWFTSLYPVVLDTAGAAGPGERLKAVKEQLRAIPMRGIGYGVLRHLGDGEVRERLAAQPEPEIVFNYLGVYDQATSVARRFRFGTGPRGADVAGANARRFLLDVGGSVRGGRLHLQWTFGEGTHRRETIQRLAERYLDALRALIAHCRAARPGGCTPSDFPLAGLSQAQLDAVVAGHRVEDLYPLSPMQEGILFHVAFGGESQAYQVQVARMVEGELDAALFQRAWGEVVSRHPILRTSFVWEGLPRPLQRVHAQAEVPWTVQDWRGLDEAAQSAALDRYLADDRALGFDVGRAPLLRCGLFRVGERAHWFVRSSHHLLLDGWASARVVTEAFRVYRAWAGGQPLELGPVRPYRDYIAWLARQDDGAAERFWRGLLADFTAPTPLGVDRPAGPEAGQRHAKRSVTLSEEATRGLERLARRSQVTLNTVMQGAWALLLSRYSGERDVVFGNVVAGRPPQLAGVEEMVGLFINTLPTRARVRGDQKLGAWLAALQRSQAEAREFEYSPLVQVQGWSEVPRGTPLFESLFVFENYPVDRGGNSDAGTGDRLRLTQGRSVEWTTYPLSLMAAPAREMLLALSYDESRFDGPVVEAMLRHLQRLLEEMAAGVELPLARLQLLRDEERRAMVHDWNDSARPFPRDVTLAQRFAQQVARDPHAEALVWGDVRMTYAQLDARTNRLARRLQGLGVGPDAPVGILLERGMELVLCELAIIKAGGCYVPLDPSYPAERLQMMMSDSGVRVLLTETALVQGAAVADSLRVVCLDVEAESIAAERPDPVESPVTPDSLAYIMYTSGSTGRPKGVMVGQREVVQLVVATDYVDLKPGDRIAQASNPSFDATTFEMWGAWLNGATLVGISKEVLLSPPALWRLLRDERITSLYQTTALLNQLTREQPDIFATVREVLFGGQAADADSLRRLVRGGGKPQRLVHVYGPTEITAWSTWEDVRAVEDDALTVTIGAASGNARMYVLDEGLNPVPVGVGGEAYVGGAGVVRGYLGRPALTAERFLPDPFATEPGTRMYRTGDRMKWLPEAKLEFIARLDEQVKIRGFRIEPGEVEAALNAYGDVKEARVIVREDQPGEKRLVAYVVGAVEGEELRAFLRRGMPEYMVPGAFVVMESLPLTPNGKLDVKALPAPELAGGAAAFTAPRTPLEEVLAEIWGEVLRLERVGVEDNFFELGGHSLLAMRVVSQVREIFGVELPLRAFFDAGTVAGLAEMLTVDPRFAAATGQVLEMLMQLD